MVPQGAKMGAPVMRIDTFSPPKLKPSAAESPASQLHAVTSDPAQIAAMTFGTKQFRTNKPK